MAENNLGEKRARARGPLTGLWRIALYYVVLFTSAYFLAETFPTFHEVVFGGFERLSEAEPVGNSLEDALVQDALNTTPMANFSQGEDAGRVFALFSIISLIGALALMIPVAWVYLLTKQRRGYDESVVQAMLILPIAVAGIVFIVQFSLALLKNLCNGRIMGLTVRKICMADYTDRNPGVFCMAYARCSFTVGDDPDNIQFQAIILHRVDQRS